MFLVLLHEDRRQHKLFAQKFEQTFVSSKRRFRSFSSEKTSVRSAQRKNTTEKLVSAFRYEKKNAFEGAAPSSALSECLLDWMSSQELAAQPAARPALVPAAPPDASPPASLEEMRHVRERPADLLTQRRCVRRQRFLREHPARFALALHVPHLGRRATQRWLRNAPPKRPQCHLCTPSDSRYRPVERHRCGAL